jgi:hypothetical protein
LFRGSGNIREIYHHLTGEHCGGFQMNSSGKISPWQAVGNQAWGAGAFCRMRPAGRTKDHHPAEVGWLLVLQQFDHGLADVHVGFRVAAVVVA